MELIAAYESKTLEDFYYFGAAIQIIDDWVDMAEDLGNGYLTYPVLGFESRLPELGPRGLADLIKSNAERKSFLKETCEKLLREAATKATGLGIPMLPYFIEKTGIRVAETFA